MNKAKVLILVGSSSDLPILKESERILKYLGIDSETLVSSAHRSPEKTKKLAQLAEKRGIKVIICAAGMAAHLAGFVAAHTTLPVIGVPLGNSYFKGTDAFLSTLQMPSGVPVATMSVGNSGAKNAAVLAAQMLALSDSKLKSKLKQFKKKLAVKKI